MLTNRLVNDDAVRKNATPPFHPRRRLRGRRHARSASAASTASAWTTSPRDAQRQQGDDLLPLRRQARALPRRGRATCSAAWARPSPTSPQSTDTPADKLDRFIEALRPLADDAAVVPALMLREIAEGAPHLDARHPVARCASSFMRLRPRSSRKARPPASSAPCIRCSPTHRSSARCMINAARERVAAQPGRERRLADVRRHFPRRPDRPHAAHRATDAGTRMAQTMHQSHR